MGSKPPIPYDPDFAVLARQKMREGYTRMELAKYFGISKPTLYKWIEAHADFAAALTRGADFADAIAEDSLYKRVKGIEYEEVETVVLGNLILREGEDGSMEKVQLVRTKRTKKFIPPDVTAGIYWTKNRRKDRWRDKPNEETGDMDEKLNALIESNRAVAAEAAPHVKREAGEGLPEFDAAVEPVDGGDA